MPDADPADPAADADATADALRAKLDRVAAHEALVHAGPLTRVLRRLGRTRSFSSLYARIGPTIDGTLTQVREGRLTARLYGLPVLMLHTTGARSGQPRTSPLLYVRDGVDIVVLGTNFGQPRHPGWTANLIAHPDAEAEIGPERVLVRAEAVDPAGWDRLFPSFVDVYPGYADYLGRREGLAPRMFRLVPVA
jgi:deazaflavin-dependent oxidoreductase (nitroreductase family)